jgi:hypothetical protein
VPRVPTSSAIAAAKALASPTSPPRSRRQAELPRRTFAIAGAIDDTNWLFPSIAMKNRVLLDTPGRLVSKDVRPPKRCAIVDGGNVVHY